MTASQATWRRATVIRPAAQTLKAAPIRNTKARSCAAGTGAPRHSVSHAPVASQHKQHMKLEIQELEERVAPSQPPGLLGYEGQPGNQGGDAHHGNDNGNNNNNGTPNGLLGYEGQPGNQGG